MNETQIKRRAELLLQLESVQRQLAEGSEGGLVRALEEIAQCLHALAVEVDATSCDMLERARNWRHLADAYMDVAGVQAPEKLKEALAFYKRAVALMEGVENSQERMLLEYGFGRALLGMVQCGDLSVVDDVRQRFARAQAIARFQAPESNELIRRALMHLQVITNLIEERRDLWRKIDQRERSRQISEADDLDQRPQTPEDAALFERLLQLCERTAQVRGCDVQGH